MDREYKRPFTLPPSSASPQRPQRGATLAGVGPASQDEGGERLGWPSPGPIRASGVAPSSSETTLSWHRLPPLCHVIRAPLCSITSLPTIWRPFSPPLTPIL